MWRAKSINPSSMPFAQGMTKRSSISLMTHLVARESHEETANPTTVNRELDMTASHSGK
jgi:hypothetical protein